MSRREEKQKLAVIIRDKRVQEALMQLSTLVYDAVTLYLIRHFPAEAPPTNFHSFPINVGILRLYVSSLSQQAAPVHKTGHFLAEARHYLQ